MEIGERRWEAAGLRVELRAPPGPDGAVRARRAGQGQGRDGVGRRWRRRRWWAGVPRASGRRRRRAPLRGAQLPLLLRRPRACTECVNILCPRTGYLFYEGVRRVQWHGGQVAETAKKLGIFVIADDMKCMHI
uniref:Uncharacterized protein n=1 Tax=Oryza punctata TaxID=4537 RepID=A0A0E0MGD0_ORYPU